MRRIADVDRFTLDLKFIPKFALVAQQRALDAAISRTEELEAT